MTLLVALLACATAPTAPVRLTLGVAIPLHGPDQARGEELLRGVRLAAGDAFAVLVDDDGKPGAADDLARLPEVVGVVGHVGQAAAEHQVADWVRLKVPTVVAAPGEWTGLPRVVPRQAGLAACAATLLGDGPYVVRTDGQAASVAAARVLETAMPEGFGGEAAVSPDDVRQQAERLGTTRVVWLGDAQEGGNFLHALRALGGPGFFGVAGATPGFLQAAASAAEGARVTGLGRPSLDSTFKARFVERYGQPATATSALGYDAAALLIAAWQAAHARGGDVPRDAILAQLEHVEASGSAGPMRLDDDGVLSPVTCQVYRVEGGQFVEEVASADPRAVPATPPRLRRRSPPEGEWLRPPAR